MDAFRISASTHTGAPATSQIRSEFDQLLSLPSFQKLAQESGFANQEIEFHITPQAEIFFRHKGSPITISLSDLAATNEERNTIRRLAQTMLSKVSTPEPQGSQNQKTKLDKELRICQEERDRLLAEVATQSSYCKALSEKRDLLRLEPHSKEETHQLTAHLHERTAALADAKKALQEAEASLRAAQVALNELRSN